MPLLCSDVRDYCPALFRPTDNAMQLFMALWIVGVAHYVMDSFGALCDAADDAPTS